MIDIKKLARNYVKWVNCPKCGHQKYTKFVRGDIWMNDRDYKVKILDFGFDDVWVLYLENGNKTAWEHDKFINQYFLLK